MPKPPSRYDVTIRVAKEDGHQPRPGCVRGYRRPGSLEQERQRRQRDTAQAIICLVSVAAPDRPSAVAVALAVVADALKAASRLPSPTRAETITQAVSYGSVAAIAFGTLIRTDAFWRSSVIDWAMRSARSRSVAEIAFAMLAMADQ